MSRAIRQGLPSILGVVALVGALAWAVDRPVDPTSSDTAAVTVAQRPGVSVAPVALRAPAPCARAEQPRHDLDGRDASLIERPGAPHRDTTPLYARLRVYRL